MRDTFRPPELQIEGCIIEITGNAPANVGRSKSRYRVTEVAGPYPPDPDWYVRPHLGGWTLVCKDDREGIVGDRTRWINEVFAEDGKLFAYPWRDQIEVVEVREGQMRLF